MHFIRTLLAIVGVFAIGLTFWMALELGKYRSAFKNSTQMLLLLIRKSPINLLNQAVLQLPLSG